jgi:cytoskeleton protein RodZ
MVESANNKQGESRTPNGRRLHLREVSSEYEDYEGIGADLRAARTRNGQSLADLASVLRIRYEFLEAVEQGRFADLPAPVYAVGFVRTYAEYVGVASDDAIRRFKEEAEGLSSQSPLSFPTPEEESRVPRGWLLVLAGVSAALIYAGWYYAENKDRLNFASVPPVPERLASRVVEQPPAVVVPAVVTPEATTPADVQPDPEPESEVIVAAPETSGAVTLAEPAVAPIAEPDAVTEPAATQTGPQQTAAVEQAAPSEPVVQSTQAAEPVATEPVVTEPVAAEPVVAEPVVVEPVVVEPVVVEPVVVEPVVVEPVVTEPVAAEPVVAEPVAVEPVAVETAAVEPAAVEPKKVEPAAEPAAETAAEPVKVETAKVETASVAPEPAAPVVPQSSREAAAEPEIFGAGNWNGRVQLEARVDVWVQISTTEGDILLSHILRQGDKYLVPLRDDVVLTTGNAGALQISVDGKVISAVGPPGAVRRDVSLSADRLLGIDTNTDAHITN